MTNIKAIIINYCIVILPSEINLEEAEKVTRDVDEATTRYPPDSGDRTPVVAITKTPVPIPSKESALQSKLSKLDLGDVVLYPQDKLGRDFLKIVGCKRFSRKDDATRWQYIVRLMDVSLKDLSKDINYWKSTGKRGYAIVKCILGQYYKIAKEFRVAGIVETVDGDVTKLMVDDMYDRHGLIRPDAHNDDDETIALERSYIWDGKRKCNIDASTGQPITEEERQVRYNEIMGIGKS